MNIQCRQLNLLFQPPSANRASSRLALQTVTVMSVMFLFNYRIKRNSIQRQHKLCVDIKVKPNALWMILTRYGNLSSTGSLVIGS